MGNIGVTHDKEFDIAIYTLEGDVTYADIRDAIDEYYDGKLTKYTLWDFSMMDLPKNFTGEHARLLGGQVNTLGKERPEGAVDLIIVPDIVQFGLARVYAAYSEFFGDKPGTLKTMIFRKKDDALRWVRGNEKMEKA
ncbi:MAG: hypothetical protein JW803_06860 [Endomicrobiales bacterium]|nr:hypothetical protein [Endomicrobiales bacterium]